MKWTITKDGKPVKSFPYYEQCAVWLFEHGYISYARGKNILQNGWDITHIGQ